MTAPEEIVPGVYGVALGFVNAFVLVDDAVTLVDTGIKARAPRIAAFLKDLGRRDVANIALTHHHADHRGGLGLLRAEGVKLFVHPIDAQVVRGDRKPPGPQAGGPVRRALFTVLGPLLMNAPTQPVDVELTEGDDIPGTGGLRAVHTPGHTMGHVSLLHEPTGVLITGDAIWNVRKMRWCVRAFCTDIRMTEQTADVLGELDYEVAAFTHGKHIKDHARERVRAFLRDAERFGGKR